MIKPTFFLDEKLGMIARDARLLYIGLWNLSDDRGVFEWRPARIKIQLFPYDVDIGHREIENWLKMLESTGDVIYFQEEGIDFGYIPTFLKHQDIKNPSKWTFTSTLPDRSNHKVSSPLLTEGEKIVPKPKKPEKDKSAYGQFENVMLTDDEHKKLVDRFGESEAKNLIEELSEALKSKKGYAHRFTDHYATILSWARRKNNIQPEVNRQPKPPKITEVRMKGVKLEE